MSAPRMSPNGFVSVVSKSKMQGKLKIFGFGQDDRIVNEGDLLIVSNSWVVDNGGKEEVEFSLKIRGRDLHLFIQAAQEAQILYNDHKHYLQSPHAAPADSRPLSKQRSDDSKATLAAYLRSS